MLEEEILLAPGFQSPQPGLQEVRGAPSRDGETPGALWESGDKGAGPQAP